MGMTAEERARELASYPYPRESHPDTHDAFCNRIAAAIRAAEQAAEVRGAERERADEVRRCLDLVHSYYVTGLTESQMRAVDSTVIAIRGAIRDRAKPEPAKEPT